jgi:hypothetical protein
MKYPGQLVETVQKSGVGNLFNSGFSIVLTIFLSAQSRVVLYLSKNRFTNNPKNRNYTRIWVFDEKLYYKEQL